MHFNTKYIFKGDTKKDIIEKINYNFDQILSFAVGPDGHQGAIGATGIYGPAGRNGSTGASGIRASNWYKQPTEPLSPNTNDVWIDNSITDGNIKVFNYPIPSNTWNDSGYTFLNSQYFKSYSNILGPGGSIDKYVIGFKYPGGITGSSDTSLVINDSYLPSSTVNVNNSKVLVSTLDQIDRPIMAFSKNGAISSDVPSFYWNSVGNNSDLKFDSGGSFYITTNLDFLIDSDLARTIITSEYCTIRSNLGRFTLHGDGDFSFSSNVTIGVGGFLNILTSNFIMSDGSVNHNGGVTITSPLTSTYILSSNPSSPSYQNGISAEVRSGNSTAFMFTDYTGNPVLSAKPSGSSSSGNFAQTIIGSTGGATGGTAGPFSYHVKKVKEIRQSTTSLSARAYLTTTTTNLVDVFDLSSNTTWENDNIIATPTAYGSVTSDSINSYKIGETDVDFNYSAPLNIFGSGFKRDLTGLDQYNAIVNDAVRLSDGSIICVGNFKYYNEQPIKTGSLSTVLSVCKINPDGTLNTTFRTNLSAITLNTVLSVNGILLYDTGTYSTSRIFVYGSFSHSSSGKWSLISMNLDGAIDTGFNNNMNFGFNSGSVVNKAILDGGPNIIAVGNFSSYQDTSASYTRNKLIKITGSGLNRGKCIGSFMGTVGQGFIGGSNIPYCLDIMPSGNIIIGGTFSTYNNSTGTSFPTINLIQVNGTNGNRVINTGFSNMSFTAFTSGDAAISVVKYNPIDFYVYIGGTFTSINSTTRNRIARYSEDFSNFYLDTTFSTGTGFNDIVNDFIFTTDFSNDFVYVGGRFTTYNGTTTPGYVRLITTGAIDTTASIYHNPVSPGTINSGYTYPIGLVKKMLLDSINDKFTYVGGFLNTIFSGSGAIGGVYLKVPSSLSSDYIPVYTDGTTTNYRVFLNDPGSDPKLRYISGLVFDTGLPTAVTSFIDFSTGVTGCQYVDLMWVSKTSTANIVPRLFYKNCQGISGYVDFGANGVYSVAGPPVINTSQSATVTWEFNRDQTGGCSIYKNGTSTINRVLLRTSSGNGTLSYSVGDQIYASVSSGSSSTYMGIYSYLGITKTSLTTGITTVLFSGTNITESGTISNFSNPITIESGFSYDISCVTQSELISSSGCCFVGDTEITLSDGRLKTIDEIFAGESILTYNPETSEYGEGIVTHMESPIKDDIIDFILSNGTLIQVTTEHPFWVLDKGWSSYSPERTMLDHKMSVSKLEEGDILLDIDGNEVTLLAMNDNNQPLQRVYNIIMNEGNHTYYANGILVHNKLEYNFAP